MLKRYNSVVLFLIALLAVVATLAIWPQRPANYLFGLDLPGSGAIVIGDFEREGFRLGLDLRGGTELLLQADLSEVEPLRRGEAMTGLRQIIERRVNAFGVAEPIIQQVGDDRISVQLAGVTDIAEAKRLVGSTANLEFKEQLLDERGNPVLVNGAVQWIPATGVLPDGTVAELTGRFLNPNAALTTGQTGLPEVAFEFNEQGGILFGQITQRLLGRQLGIFLDDVLISAPTVQAPLTRRGVITGLSAPQAQQLVIQLNSGALPVPVEIIKEQTVDATLGSDSIQRSIVAGQIGLLLVVLFMILYYRLPGLLATAALFVYAVTTLALFKMIPVTLTLSGIAAFILSIGMAVDANILIFERTREELRWGKTLAAAIEAGFDRAWTSIRDSNVATLITCAILFWYGSSSGTALVSGFALTLAIGVLVSLFSAIIVTRSLMRGLLAFRWARNPLLYGVKPGQFQGEPPPRPGWMDFVKRRYVYFAISLAIIVPGLVSMAIPPSFNLGIEFTSGTSLTVEFRQPVEPGAVRAVLDAEGLGDAIVQRVGTEGTEYLLRTRTLAGPQIGPGGEVLVLGQQEALVQALAALPEGGGATLIQADTVSPIIAGETIRNSVLAVLLAAVGILFYIWWAFRQIPHPIRYATCAIITLVHDAILVLGLVSIAGKLFGVEINALTITAVLTVIGFSVHDTIVVFDRIRENLKTRPVYDVALAVNDSILQTLSRSLNTTTTTVITLTALLLFGGVTIQSFVAVLIVGILVGTYSSIFNASQLLVVWENGELARFFRRGPKEEPPPPPARGRRKPAASPS